MSALRLLSATKLYWGLLAILVIGIAFSPETSSGRNIFVSYGNLTDILRQVSITGLVAVGMTTVILIGGIDLSVGSVMAFGSVVAARLLTQSEWSFAALFATASSALIGFACVYGLVRFVMLQRQAAARAHQGVPATRWPAVAAGLAGGLALALVVGLQVPGKVGVIGVLVAAACVGAILGTLNGIIIVAGRLQPFIVTLAMMVGALGAARLTAGQNSAVIAVYSGSNATENVDLLRTMLWGIVPVPGLFFLATVAVFGALLRFTSYGRYVYAIGGNEEATRLSGIPIARIKVVTYALSGLLAALAGVLYIAQFRQGKPDAGAGLELDAIAAVVIGGTSLMGGRGSVMGTLVGVLIFGLLSNILQLHNINSNLQLVFKGLIIVVTVLLQERNLAELLEPFAIRARSPGPAGSTVPIRGTDPDTRKQPAE